MPPRSTVTVTKQSPTDRKPTKPSLNGRMLDRAIDVADLEDLFIKMLLYGGNRTGKTTLACQFPKPLLLVAFELAPTGGARSVKRVSGVDYLRLDSTKAGMQLADELRSDTKYRSVVVDSVTSYQDLVLKEILNLPAVPTMLGWGMVTKDEYRMRSERTREGLRPFADLAKHTVFIGKERDHNPPKDEGMKVILNPFTALPDGAPLGPYMAVDLGGATVQWLQDCCDFITRLYVEEVYEERVTKGIAIKGQEAKESRKMVATGKFARYLRLNWHNNCAAGIRSDTPINVPDFIKEPTFEKLETIIKGGTIKD